MQHKLQTFILQFCQFPLNTRIITESGSLLSVGTNATGPKSIVAKLDGFGNVKFVFYVGIPITLGTGGSTDVNPSTVSTQASSSVNIASSTGLAIDQTAVRNITALNGANLTLASGSRTGITNATSGTVFGLILVHNDGTSVPVPPPIHSSPVLLIIRTAMSRVSVRRKSPYFHRHPGDDPPCGYGARSDDRRPYVPRSGTRCRHEPLG